MKKLIVMLMIFCLFSLVGCGAGGKDDCKRAAEMEYGAENVFELNNYRYLVKEENGQIFYIEKMSATKPWTTMKKDITNWIKE